MAKKISFGLSTKEIERAIKEVENYKKELNQKCQLLVQALTDKGIEIAKMNVVDLGAYFTGELVDSIDGYYSPTQNVGIIYAGSYYAVWVEFGTGIKGKNASHPMAGEIGYQYDVNNHGENGWFFTNESTGVSGWTTGMPSRPFMYNMARRLERECGRIAKEIFKK